MGMQCANISHTDVFTILDELAVVAEDNGYDKTILEEMKERLK